MKISSRDKLIIAIIIVVAVAAAAVLLLVVPQYRRAADLRAQIDATDQEIQQAQALLQRRQSAKQVAAMTEADLLRLQNQVPEAPELPSFIVELQDAANRVGLEFAELAPSAQPEAESGYLAFPMSVRIRGSWSDYIEFLEEIDDFVREVRVTNYSAAAAAGEESTTTAGTQLLDVTMQIEVYTIAPAGEQGGAPPPPPSE